MWSMTRDKAWKWWFKNPTLQAYNDTQEDDWFETFCVDLMVDIAVDEMRPDVRDMDEYEADEYTAKWFNFNCISAEELIKEFEREES